MVCIFLPSREKEKKPAQGFFSQHVKKASQSSRLGCREYNPIDFPATCAAENLPVASSEWACSTPQPR